MDFLLRHFRPIHEPNNPAYAGRKLSPPLRIKTFLGLLFLYRPLTEQRRIVARIKECMERVEEIEKKLPVHQY